MQFASEQQLGAHLKNVPSYQSFSQFQSLRSRSKSGSIDPLENPLLSSEHGSIQNSANAGAQQAKSAVKMSLRLWMAIFAVAIGSSFQFGYGTGVMNNSEIAIRTSFCPDVNDLNNCARFSTFGWSVAVSMFGAGGLIGAVLGSEVLSKHMGRKMTLLTNNVFVFISCGLIAFASSWWMMAIGRVFIGMVAGIATGVVPIYFSEISPTKVRGAVGTAHQLGITLGILASQVLSTPSLHVFGSPALWPWLFVIPAACALLELVLLPFCPESPSYLFKTQGEAAARSALYKLHRVDKKAMANIMINSRSTGIGPGGGSAAGTDEMIREARAAVVDRYIRNIAAESERGQEKAGSSKGSSSTGSSVNPTTGAGSDGDASSGGGSSARMTLLQLLRARDLRRQLFAGVVVQLSMQFSGIDAVFYYSTEVFTRAGVANAPLATTLLGVINVLVTIVAVKIMDSAGRRTLLLTSWVGMCTSYLALATSFLLMGTVSFSNQLAVVAMIGVIVFFAFGPGCIAWFIIAEIFPMYAKDTAMALGVALNWIANWLVAFSFPHIQLALGNYTFFLFAGTTAFFFVFTYRNVPETKGKTIKEVIAEFQQLGS